jgi:beta-phosphoglucomutase-like phosphatase (HAD superfamily)
MSTEYIYSTIAHRQVILKYAPEVRLQREKEILRRFEGDAYIRQLIDHNKEAPFLVLEFLDSDALRWSRQARVPRQDVKIIAHSILSALESLHAKGIAHTGNTTHSYATPQKYPNHSCIKMSSRTTFYSTSTPAIQESWKLSWPIVVSLSKLSRR